MNIACYLIKENGALKEALLPEELLLDLAKTLRIEGKEILHFNKGESIIVEGIFIPAKGTKHGIMALPNIGED